MDERDPILEAMKERLTEANQRADVAETLAQNMRSEVRKLERSIAAYTGEQFQGGGGRHRGDARKKLAAKMTDEEKAELILGIARRLGTVTVYDVMQANGGIETPSVASTALSFLAKTGRLEMLPERRKSPNDHRTAGAGMRVYKLAERVLDEA